MNLTQETLKEYIRKVIKEDLSSFDPLVDLDKKVPVIMLHIYQTRKTKNNIIYNVANKKTNKRILSNVKDSYLWPEINRWMKKEKIDLNNTKVYATLKNHWGQEQEWSWNNSNKSWRIDR